MITVMALCKIVIPEGHLHREEGLGMEVSEVEMVWIVSGRESNRSGVPWLRRHETNKF